MTISLVGTATGTTTCTVPTHAIGDLIVIAAYRSSTTHATVPAGYSPNTATALAGTGTTSSLVIGYRIATATNDSSGTWTNSTALVCHVYRASSGYTAGLGNSAFTHQTTNTINYPALTLADSTSGNSWVAGFCGCSNTTNTIAVAPSGMTNESHETASATQCAGHDTEGGVTSWASTNATTTGTAGDTVSAVVEIILLPNSTSISNVYQHIGGGGNPLAGGRGIVGNPYFCPMPNSSGAGNTIVLAITNDGGATITSISDNINGTWPAASVTALAGSGSLDSRIYVFPNVAAGLVTITVTYSANVTTFQYCMTELHGIATVSPVNGTTSATASTTTAAGSFTPGSNTGGNLLWAYFIKSATTPSDLTRHIFAGPFFTLLDADITWSNAGNSCTKAVEAYIQTTPTAINPSITSAADSGDTWNSLCVALKISSGAGTAPASGIRINGIQHFTTLSNPTSGNLNLQVSTTGNLRVVQCPDPNQHAQTVTDSEGNTWTSDGTALPTFWYLANAVANPNLLIFADGGGTDPVLSWRFIDISGAATSPFDSAVAQAQNVSSVTSFTTSTSISPSNTNGLVIWGIGLGNGPGIAVTSPSGAIWDYCTYTGETDSDLIENADIFAHYNNSASGSIPATFTITSIADNSTSGGIIAFIAASGGTVHNQSVSVTSAESFLVVKNATLPIKITSAELVSLLKQISWITSASSVESVSLNKSVGWFTAVTSAESISTNKQVGKTLSVTSNESYSLVKQVNKILSAVSSEAVSLAKQIGAVLLIASGETISAIKQVYKYLLGNSAESVSVAESEGAQQISVSVNSAETVFDSKQVGKNINSLFPESVSVIKQIGAILKVSSAETIAFVKQIGVIINSVSAESTTNTKRIGKNIGAVSAQAVSYGRQVGNLIVVSSAQTISTIKLIGYFLGASSAESVTTAQSRGQQDVNVSVSSGETALLQKQVGKNLVIASVELVSLIKRAAYIVSVVSSQTVIAIKQTGYFLGINSSESVAVSEIKSRTTSVAINQPETISTVKIVDKNIGVQQQEGVSSIRRLVAYIMTVGSQVISVVITPSANLISVVVQQIQSSTVTKQINRIVLAVNSQIVTVGSRLVNLLGGFRVLIPRGIRTAKFFSRRTTGS